MHTILYVVSMFALEPVPDLCGQGVIAKLILVLRYLVYVRYGALITRAAEENHVTSSGCQGQQHRNNGPGAIIVVAGSVTTLPALQAARTHVLMARGTKA